jgi:hypothetical protein
MKSLRMMRRPWLSALLIVGLGALILEVLLRIALGFGNLPRYYGDTAYEYALLPSQDVKRFGNHFYINNEGMRSAPLGKDGFRFLKLGDSVLNGGIATDQTELASTLLEERLSTAFPEKGIRVLNVSAGSWGPDNAFAWVQKHGAFGAKAIVLVFSSHDWQDQMTFRDVVGKVPFYPKERPPSAIGDAGSWLVSRYFTTVDWDKLPQIPESRVLKNNHNIGWEAFDNYCQQSGVALLVYHHPNKAEWEAGSWNVQGSALEEWLVRNGVKVISGLNTAYGENGWRDEIHPNAQGQRALADALEPAFKTIIEQQDA